MKNAFAALCLVLFAGCAKKEMISLRVAQVSSEKSISHFALITGSDTLHMSVTDSTIEGLSLDTMHLDSMVAYFEISGKKLLVDGVEQLSGVTAHNVATPFNYDVVAEDGSLKSYKLKLRTFTGLPIIYITSPEVTSKDVYVDGWMKVKGNIDYPDKDYRVQLKGRGNSTWGKPKNPYKIKLTEKASILGMPADKEWALLANYFDKSLLRNDLAFEFSERMNMAWTPKRRLVEVFMNGEYNGSYLLTETVKIANDRLNIKAINEKNPADTSNGYLLEANFRMDGQQNFVTKWGARFSMKEPEVVTQSQFDYITRQMLDIESGIEADNDLSDKIDVDSWIKWTIVNEVLRNRDAVLYGSVNFYQGAGRKLFMGPVWDFDLSAGGYEGNDPTGWYITNSNIVGQAYQVNTRYRTRFREIWNEYRPQIVSLVDYLDRQEALIKYSQEMNFKRWDIMSVQVYEEQVTHATYAAEISALRAWLKTRIEWLDKAINE